MHAENNVCIRLCLHHLNHFFPSHDGSDSPVGRDGRLAVSGCAENRDLVCSLNVRDMKTI